MDAANDEVHTVLALIEGAGLVHPSGPLLSAFVTEALNPLLAARYAKARLLRGEGSSLVADWSYIIESITIKGSTPRSPNADERQSIIKRDGNRCCITGKRGTFRDPLVVAPILPVPSGWITTRDEINNMLGAFFGPPYLDWWLSYASNPDLMSPYHNHWLVRRSAAEAFARGLVRLDRRQPSMIEYEIRHVLIMPEEPIEIDGTYPLLGDHSRHGITKVDARFLGSHARLSKSIQLVAVSKALSSKVPCQPPVAKRKPLEFLFRKFSTVLSAVLSVALAAWRTLPSSIKFSTYATMHKLGGLMYRQEHQLVQRLPFGLYLKRHGESAELRNEFNALRMVRRHTSIPTPLALDVVSATAKPSGASSESYLLTTKVPGIPLFRCLHVLSDSDCEEIARQLKDYVVQLRAVPRSQRPGPNVISNTLGEACRDCRIRGGMPIGPFANEAAFSQLLRFSDDPARRGHKIVFTHADLNPRNILVDKVTRSDGTSGWRITGIVDWENAGHYPEYWEYTKALFEGFRWPQRYNNIIHGVFSEFGDYSKEFDVEKRSWESGDAV
ncbi:kinase-like domain-containing protein [Podospora aff. communis PSN243]|uniref:Kinase-like domain-containing protein n=1 Tax=Podospora aff. communis PSN243 TaxID=3040156 RepID=A0AAV9GDX4_9PEZI|nr:kinase-like domain-containing protein [Podospora aff. communis PSN243]